MKKIFFFWCNLLLQACVHAALNFGNQNSAIEFAGSGSYFLVNTPINNFSGTLKAQDNSVGRIVGQNLVFNNGIIKFENESDLNFTGTFAASSGNQLTLTNATDLVFATGKTVSNKILVPAGATVKISGFPILTQPIVLADNTATLRLAIKSNLGQDIYLNGGTLILDDDLTLSVGSKILGGGTIDINKKRFSYSGNFANADITYLNAEDLTLTGDTTYTTNQTFAGTNNDIFGGGCNISLSAANGRITVNAASTFKPVNVNFTGIAGTSNVSNFGVFNINATGTALFQNSTLALSGNYTQATGTMIFRQNCKIIDRGFLFNVTGATQIIVDGSTLEIDNLDEADALPFTFTDQASQLKLINGGNIRSTVTRGPYNLSTTSGQLYSDYVLSSDAKISITQPSTTLNGGGFAMHFPTTGTGLITLANNATVTTSNIILNGFNKDVLTYGTGAALNFGTNTQLRLFDDVTISGADRSWNFNGTSGSITGSGSRINYTGSNNITVGAGCTVTARDLRFNGLGASGSNGIFSINATGTLILENCTLDLAANYTHNAGTIIIRNGCRLVDNGFIFGCTGLGFLRVDGTAFEYENLGSSDISPFTFTDVNSQQVLVNGGIIRSSVNRGALNLTTNSGQLYNDFVLSAAAPISITQPSTTFNGGGFAMHFPTTGTGLITLANSATVTTNNIILNGFNKDTITYGTGASFSFGTATQLRLFDDVTISGADRSWNFNGTSGSITGSGSRINYTGSNNITVGAGCTVTARDLRFSGLGASGSNGIFSINATGTLILENCTLDLAANYTHNAGTIIIRNGCRLVDNGFIFGCTGLGFLRIDGTAFEYENLGSSDVSPFTFTDVSSQQVLLNGGIIRSSINRGALNLTTTTGTLYDDFVLSAASPISITQPSTTLNGGGFAMHFPTTGSGLITLANNATVTTSNIILNCFNKGVVTYGTGAALNFGTNTQLRLFDDVTISGADKNWNFTGSGQVFGSGSTLILDGINKLTVTNSSTLTLKNLRIVCQNLNALACFDAGSKIVFENCTLAIPENNLELATGNFDVLGELKVVGGNTAVVSTQAKLIFSSQGFFRVLSNSRLMIERGVQFEYRANPAGDGANTAATKRHFLLQDPTATLELHGSSLRSTTTGFALNYGRLVFDDVVTLQVDGTLAQSMELGSAVEVFVRPSAVVEVDGILTYINTSYP